MNISKVSNFQDLTAELLQQFELMATTLLFNHIVIVTRKFPVILWVLRFPGFERVKSMTRMMVVGLDSCFSDHEFIVEPATKKIKFGGHRFAAENIQ